MSPKRLASLSAIAMLAAAAHAFDVTCYVQEDLIAQWDGIDNAGLGYHTAYTNIWKDLAGRYDLPLTAKGSWAGGDHLVVDNGCAANYGAIGPTGYKTIEIVYRQPAAMSKAGFIFDAGHRNYYAVALADGTGVFFLAATDDYAVFPSCDGAIRSVAAVYNPTKEQIDAVYTNGVDATGPTKKFDYNAGAGYLMIGDRNVSAAYPFTGDVYAIRIYSQPLTPEQVATNRLVDAVRFLGATPSDLLHVTGSPYNAPAAISPGYEGRGGLAAGDAVPVSAPSGTIAFSDDTRFVCTGWKLYDAAGTVVDHGDTLSFTYVHPTPAAYRRLEWQFDLEYRVTASGAGGTYSPAEQWVRHGGTATVEATPNDGTYLYTWSDPAAGLSSGDNPYSFTVTTPVSLAATYRNCFWVAPDGDDAYNGLTRATAKATLSAALALTSSSVAGDKVVVADGDYTVTAGTTIDKPCTVASENGPGRTRFFVGTAVRPFYVNNANAILKGVTIYSDGTSLGVNALNLAAGTVRDCVVSNFNSGGSNPVYLSGGTLEGCTVTGSKSSGRIAGGVWMEAASAVLRNCVIVGNTGENNTYGSAIHIKAGTAYGCLVYCNTNTSSGVAGIKNAGGTVESCTVADNYAKGGRVAPGIWNASGRTVRNCLAYGNRNLGGPLDTLGDGTFAHCATGTTAPAGTGNIRLGADPFADAASGNYRVAAGLTVDAGLAQSWMTGSTDLDGNPRLAGAAPDIGCFETVPGALAVAASPSAALIVGDGALSFTATPTGTNLTGLAYDWLVTDQTGATVASATGDTTGTLAIPAGYGAYTVTVTAANAAGETATWTREALAARVPETLYVAKGSTPTFPYATWETAAPDLATALAWCDDGSTVIMGDGLWTHTAATTLSRAITVKSLNGADATSIYTQTATSLFTLNHPDARIEGITLFSDHTSRSMKALMIYDGTFADGVVSNFFASSSEVISLCSQNAILTNSVVIRNEETGRCNTIHAGNDEFGRSGGKILDCRVIGNVGNNNDYGTAVCAYSGSALIRGCLIACNTNKNTGASAVNLYNNASTLESCTIVENRVTGSSSRAAVVNSGNKPTVRNCILHDNQNTGGVANWSGTASCFTYCCTTPLPQEDKGNIEPREPMFAGADWRIGTGFLADSGTNQTWMATAFDLDGNPRIANEVVDLGCYEYIPGALECSAVPSAPVIVGNGEVTLTAIVSGGDPNGLAYSWLVVDQDGRTATNVTAGADATLTLSPGYGAYDVTLTVRDGGGAEASFSASALFQIKPETVFVATDSTPTYPYDTRDNAFASVAEAIAFAEDGMRVVVTDGTYTNATNPTLGKNVTVESENGPGATTVFAVNGTTIGWTLNSPGAVLRGLTLLSDDANGSNSFSGNDRPSAVHVVAGTLDNCVVTNWVSYYTPLFTVSGASSVVTNCTITGCRGRYRCHLASFSDGLVTHTRFVRNTLDTSSTAYGAIIYVAQGSAVIRNCLIADNETKSKPEFASGIYMAGGNGQHGVIENCTVANIAATGSATAPAIHVVAGTFRNNISWGNTNTAGASGASAASALVATYSCAPGLTGTGCVEDDPHFRKAAAGDYRLLSKSPCIDTGLNQPWMEGAEDFGGNARVNAHRALKVVDMGCFEYSRLPETLLMVH